MPDDGRINLPDLNPAPVALDGPRIEGVVLGTLVALRDGAPLIHHDGLGEDERQLASAARSFGPEDLGAEIAIVFVGADPARPLVIGKLERPSRPSAPTRAAKRELVLEAERKVTIRCGRSSVTLNRDGRLELRGKYLLSRASSVNRIRGGVIQLN